MISKGTTHDSGGRLARYLVNGKEGERTELYELRGFASADIVDAFRSVHVIAEATKCQKPFFHVQIRLPEKEQLKDDQWVYTANRIERMMGLTDQPRAIAFHVDEKSGERHMHVAWSRIDDTTLTAKPLPYYKERLKRVSRELEVHFDLTLVPNERESTIKYAPTRAEGEQARRLGVDIHAIRQTIRDCYEKSDCGRSFEAALADENLLLAKGDRRDYVVVDPAGGTHAIGKRILGVSAKDIRQHLSDLDPNHLLTVEQARERATVQKDSREKDEVVWDRDKDHSRWLDEVVKAAIEKEKAERQFVEPARRPATNEIERSPFAPPEPKSPAHPLLNVTPPEFWFSDAGREVARDTTPQVAPDHLKGAVAEIWLAYNQASHGRDFAARLESHGMVLASVTKEEADQSYREAIFAKAVGNFAPVYREGETVVVTENERVYKLNERTTGDNRAGVDKFLARLDRAGMQGIAATKQALIERADQREIERQAFRDLSAVGLLDRNEKPARQNTGRDLAAPALRSIAGKTFDAVANAVAEVFELFGATAMTPERIEAAAEARERAVEQAEIDHGLSQAEMDDLIRVENRREHEAEAQREREYYEQGLDDRQR